MVCPPCFAAKVPRAPWGGPGCAMWPVAQALGQWCWRGTGSGKSLTAGLDEDETLPRAQFQSAYRRSLRADGLPASYPVRQCPERFQKLRSQHEQKKNISCPAHQPWPHLTWPDQTRANGLEVGTHFFWTLACEPRWRDVAQEGKLNTFTGRPKWAIRRWKSNQVRMLGKVKGGGLGRAKVSDFVLISQTSWGGVGRMHWVHLWAVQSLAHDTTNTLCCSGLWFSQWDLKKFEEWRTLRIYLRHSSHSNGSYSGSWFQRVSGKWHLWDNWGKFE